MADTTEINEGMTPTVEPAIEEPTVVETKRAEEPSKREQLEQRLKDVDDAIHAVLVGGQSYKIGSRALTRADLYQLYQMQKQLRGQLDAEDSMLMDDTYVAVFDRR